jgi:hypothetical protein
VPLAGIKFLSWGPNMFLSYPHGCVTVGNVAWEERALGLLQYYEGHGTVSETE